MEVTHSVHKVGLLRVRGLAPDPLWFLLRREHTLDKHVSVPVARDEQGDVLSRCLLALLHLCKDFTVKLGNVFVLCKPAPSVVIHEASLVRSLPSHFHGLSNVDVGCSNHEVVTRHGRQLDLIPLIEVEQVHVHTELLIHDERFAAELEISLLIGLVQVVALLAATVAGSHRWVVRHLLCQVLKVIIDKFVSFTKKWIEWLGGSSLTDRHRSGAMNGNQCKPHRWILLFARPVKQVIVLH